MMLSLWFCNCRRGRHGDGTAGNSPRRGE
jgi:hypothetical protein